MACDEPFGVSGRPEIDPASIYGHLCGASTSCLRSVASRARKCAWVAVRLISASRCRSHGSINSLEATGDHAPRAIAARSTSDRSYTGVEGRDRAAGRAVVAR